MVLLMCLHHQDLSEDLDLQEDKAQAVVKELGLISSVASPQALDPLTQDASRLSDSFSHTRDLIQRRRDDQGKDLVTAIRGPLYTHSLLLFNILSFSV